MFSAMVSEKRNGSCGTNPIAARSVASGNLAHVDAVEEDGAGRRLVQPRQQVDERRLARTGGADERRRLARLDAERHVLERRASRDVGYVNVRSRISIAPRITTARPAGDTARSSISGVASSTSSIRFHEAMPRCRMLVTQPKAIIGQLNITR